MKSTINSIILILSVSIVSCSSAKKAQISGKNFNGNWQLQTLASEGASGKVNSMLFNEADLNCFVGSLWTFDSREQSGNYAVAKNGDECASLKRNFRWKVFYSDNNAALLQIYRLEDNLAEIQENRSGFDFTVLQQDKVNMQLRSEIYFDGKPISLVYNFVRTK